MGSSLVFCSVFFHGVKMCKKQGLTLTSVGGFIDGVMKR
jgi:hypothetical protein